MLVTLDKGNTTGMETRRLLKPSSSDFNKSLADPADSLGRTQESLLVVNNFQNTW
jgi:hypothetical protein